MPGVRPEVLPPSELVHLPVPERGWHEAVLRDISRVKVLVVGPGLGAAHAEAEAVASGVAGGGEVGALAVSAPVPLVLDADALNAIGTFEALRSIVAARSHPTVVTPHDGEYARLAGRAPGPDRLGAARWASARSGAIVLLKGSTTIVAAPDGRALVSAAGRPTLATAGTGDVLSGIIGAFVARGVPAFEAAALAAHVHGRAAGTGHAEGLVAGDLPDLVAAWLSRFTGEGARP
jgi:NAD(P)H-hydrate epimerase